MPSVSEAAWSIAVATRSCTRADSNAEFQCVESASSEMRQPRRPMPRLRHCRLTTITAWELLFDRFGVTPERPAVHALPTQPVLLLYLCIMSQGDPKPARKGKGEMFSRHVRVHVHFAHLLFAYEFFAFATRMQSLESLN